MTAPRRQPTAFTLAESLLASIILAMIVSSMVMPFVAGAQNDQANARQALAVALAEDLMEEILGRPFDDPDGTGSVLGVDAGEVSADRTTFDNVDDYDGHNEVAGDIVPSQQVEVSDPLAASLSRHVTIEYVQLPGQGVVIPPDACRITVRVRYGGGDLVTLTRLAYANRP